MCLKLPSAQPNARRDALSSRHRARPACSRSPVRGHSSRKEPRMRNGLWMMVLSTLAGCGGSSVSDSERAEVTDSARAVVARVVTGVNKKDLAGVFAVYAADSNAWHSEDGSRHGSLAALQGAN